MTTRTIGLLLAVVLCAGVLSVALARAARVDADAARRQAAGQRALIAQQVEQLAHAQHQDDGGITLERPDTDLAGTIQSVLRAAGLQPQQLRALTAIADEPTAPGSPVHQMRYRLELVNTDLPRIGRFLHEWRQTEPTWHITALQLDLVPAAAARPGGRAMVSASLQLAAQYVPVSPMDSAADAASPP